MSYRYPDVDRSGPCANQPRTIESLGAILRAGREHPHIDPIAHHFHTMCQMTFLTGHFKVSEETIRCAQRFIHSLRHRVVCEKLDGIDRARALTGGLWRIHSEDSVEKQIECVLAIARGDSAYLVVSFLRNAIGWDWTEAEREQIKEIKIAFQNLSVRLY